MTRIRKMRAGTLAALTVPAIVGATLTAPAHATVASGTYRSYTAPNGLNSQYHVYANGIDWSKPVGVVFYIDGDYWRNDQSKIYSAVRTESAIGKTGHNAAIRVPTNLCVERIRGRKVAVPCAKTVTACIEGLRHDERQVIILVAKTWDQFHLGIGKAAVTVRSVALFNSPSGAPRWRVRCTRSIGGADPPVHRLVLNVLRRLGLHALITAARNEDRTAARAPCALTIRIQLIGDELGASGVTHRPHL